MKKVILLVPFLLLIILAVVLTSCAYVEPSSETAALPNDLVSKSQGLNGHLVYLEDEENGVGIWVTFGTQGTAIVVLPFEDYK